MGLSRACLCFTSVNVDARIGIRLPLTMAPAERWRATGGKSEPSRCHGALLCFSFSVPIAFSKVDSLLIGPSLPIPTTSFRHLLVEARFAELHNVRRSVGLE